MTTLTIADIVLEDCAVQNAEESGGWNAPEKRTEQGFEYDSYSNAEPIEARFDTWISEEVYEELDALRDDNEPFSASIGHVVLPAAKLVDLSVTEESSVSSHRRATIEIREVQEAETDEADLQVEVEDGELNSPAEDSNPSFAQSGDDDSGTGESDDDDEDGLVVGALSSARERLSGVLN